MDVETVVCVQSMTVTCGSEVRGVTAVRKKTSLQNDPTIKSENCD